MRKLFWLRPMGLIAVERRRTKRIKGPKMIFIGRARADFENAQLDAQLALASHITSSSDAVSPERRVVRAVEHTLYNSSRKRRQSR